MAFSFENNQNSYTCVNQKRCFLILLLFNCLLACIYYIHEQNQSWRGENAKKYTKPINIYSNQKENSKKHNKAMKYIRNILENEYNLDDLTTFYDIAEKEFSLGLRCTRKKNLPEITTVSNNSNFTIDQQINSNSTIKRSLNRTRISSVRRSQRSTLYSYTITNSDACSNEPVDLVIIIISKSDNYKTRDAIRRTWGSGKNLGNYSSIYIKIFFLIDFDEKLSYNIRLENNLFHDIIQVELPQQYTLVTHRVLSLFEWSFRYCRTAKFLFKTDDDIFINLILLLKFISPFSDKLTNNSFRISDMHIYGYKHYNPRVFRQANDPVGARYVVTVDEFPCGNYPDFLSGFGYLIPKKARDALVYAAYQDLDTPFRISDVYLTGILPDYLSLERHPLPGYNIRYEGNCENFFDNPKSFACAAGLHHGDTTDVFDKFNRYWQHTSSSVKLNMKQTSVILLIFHSMMVMVVCNTFSSSPVIQLSAKSLDTSTPMKQAAQILNVSIPANWNDYITGSTTNGSFGQAQVELSTLAVVMTNWLIPEEFRADAVEKVKILITAATEGSYTAQAFSFNTQSGALLTTLLIVAEKLDSPTNPNLPVAVTYVTINTRAQNKKLYTIYYTERCDRCINCLFIWSCCCANNQVNYAERGPTVAELNIIKQKLSYDQFQWFINERTLSNLVKRSLSNIQDNNCCTKLTEAIENYLSNNDAKAEVLASYNDSILTALQSNITSLKLSSQSLKLTKVERENLVVVLKELATDYGFDDISNSEKLQLPRFSYEKLFTTRTGNQNTTVIIKYIWILIQNLDNSTYTMNFLSMNITSRTLINTLLYNNVNNNDDTDKKLDIVRTSILTDIGEFISEHLPTFDTPWEMQTTETALDILRYISASVFIPQKYRMLSYFNSRIISPSENITHIQGSQSRNAIATIIGLSQAVSAMANAWQSVANAFKTSISTTITRITRLGFNYFHQKSSTLKVLDMPASKVSEFVNALIIDYSLPSKSSFLLGVTYSNDFAWDTVEYIYSPSNNGTYRSLTVFKNGDSTNNTASFFIFDVDANWQLAPDLLLVHTSRSILGGLFEDTSESIQEVPHTLTMDEAVLLQKFFMVIAIGNMAATLGINATYPSLT